MAARTYYLLNYVYMVRPIKELTAWIRKAKRNHLTHYLASHVG